MPQSICTRYGLAVGYYTAWLVRVLMVLSYPVAWPLGRLLDRVLGHGDAALPRGQLRHFVHLHGEAEGFVQLGQGLTDNELHVINSALELTHKRARAAMTPLDKVFMVSTDDVLNEALISRILATGHSRVPVFAGGDRGDVVGLLLVKELLLKVTVRVRPLPTCPWLAPPVASLHIGTAACAGEPARGRSPDAQPAGAEREHAHVRRAAPLQDRPRAHGPPPRGLPRCAPRCARRRRRPSILSVVKACPVSKLSSVRLSRLPVLERVLRRAARGAEQLEARRAALRKEDSATSRALRLSPAMLDEDAAAPLLGGSDRRAPSAGCSCARNEPCNEHRRGRKVGVCVQERLGRGQRGGGGRVADVHQRHGGRRGGHHHHRGRHRGPPPPAPACPSLHCPACCC